MSVTNTRTATAIGPIVVLVQAEGVPDSEFDLGVGDMVPGQTTGGFFDTLGPGATCFNLACTVTVTVDPNNAVVESNETNNAATRTDEPPDLTVDLLFPPSVIDCSGGPSNCTLRVDLQINNVGAGIAPGGVEYLVEAEEMPDLTLSIGEGGAIFPGGTTGGFFVTLGPGGNCFNPDCTVTVTVDPDNDLVESDETNNTATRTDAGVPIPGRIAFGSNRDGKWQIYVMNADGSGQTNLTNDPAQDYVAPSWSADGNKIAFQARVNTPIHIYTMNADGSGRTQLTDNSANDIWPSFSPDGTKIAFQSDRGGNVQIYTMNVDGSGQIRITNNSANDRRPLWSPDGSKILFYSDRDGDYEVYVMNPDGSSQTMLTNNSAKDHGPSWSPDGANIAFQSDRDGNFEIYVMNSDGSNQTRITDNSSDEFWPSFSPDGTKIAFETTRDGADEIYAMNADGSVQTNLTNNSFSDNWPSWGP
ncbi:MAG: hypothetical protein BZY88_12060 [SAR202 cluster bacterium Io17-Chloro-G9]|nr:MAG: hypothetical protein BZY88_12060 [SAR202 cluster bacterium Io17-Chloro-G9]